MGVNWSSYAGTFAYGTKVVLSGKPSERELMGVNGQ